MSERIRVVVVDDEPLARTGLSKLLASDADIDVVAMCADGAEAVTAIRTLQPDIVFLDIQMPILDGFGVLREIEQDRVPVIVFVTAYDQYALKAFDAHAIDYVLKPFENERFWLAVTRAKERCRSDSDTNVDQAQSAELSKLADRLARFLDAAERNESAAAAAYPTRMVVRNDGRIRFIRTQDLVWIEAADYYVKLHAGGKVHMLREAMNALEKRLDPAMFFRASRSAIVNLDHVREIQPYTNADYMIVLNDGTMVRLTHGRRDLLAERLGERL